MGEVMLEKELEEWSLVEISERAGGRFFNQEKLIRATFKNILDTIQNAYNEGRGSLPEKELACYFKKGRSYCFNSVGEEGKEKDKDYLTMALDIWIDPAKRYNVMELEKLRKYLLHLVHGEVGKTPLSRSYIENDSRQGPEKETDDGKKQKVRFLTEFLDRQYRGAVKIIEEGLHNYIGSLYSCKRGDEMLAELEKGMEAMKDGIKRLPQPICDEVWKCYMSESWKMIDDMSSRIFEEKCNYITKKVFLYQKHLKKKGKNRTLVLNRRLLFEGAEEQRYEDYLKSEEGKREEKEYDEAFDLRTYEGCRVSERNRTVINLGKACKELDDLYVRYCLKNGGLKVLKGTLLFESEKERQDFGDFCHNIYKRIDEINALYDRIWDYKKYQQVKGKSVIRIGADGKFDDEKDFQDYLKGLQNEAFELA